MAHADAARRRAHSRLHSSPRARRSSPADLGLAAFKQFFVEGDVPGGLDVAAGIAAELLASLPGGNHAHLFILDDAHDELTLLRSSDSAVGERGLRVAVGETVVGQAAATRQLCVTDDATDLAALVAGHAALVALPLLSSAGGLIGVVALATDDAESDGCGAAEAVAPCVAAALESARLREIAGRQERLLGRVTEAAEIVESEGDFSGALDRMIGLARDLANAELALMLLADPSGANRLTLKQAERSSAGNGHKASLCAGREELLPIVDRMRRGDLTLESAAEAIEGRLTRSLPMAVTLPMCAGGTEYGLICCFRATDEEFSRAERTALVTVASQAALLLRSNLAANQRAGEGEFVSFLRDLATGELKADRLRQRASTIGLEPVSEYRFLVGSASLEGRSEDDIDAAAAVHRQVSHALGTLAPTTRRAASVHECVALVATDDGERPLREMRAKLDRILAKTREATGASIAFGISKLTTSMDDPRAALAEAREAASIGSCTSDRGGVFTVDDVSQELLLRRVADCSEVPDRYSRAIKTLAEYDRVRGSDLVHTLSVFLDVRNRSQAARALYMHRNTLAQRLRRIQELTEVALDKSDEWFPLHLALRIHQLREPRSSVSRLASPHTDTEPQEGRV